MRERPNLRPESSQPQPESESRSELLESGVENAGRFDFKTWQEAGYPEIVDKGSKDLEGVQLTREFFLGVFNTELKGELKERALMEMGRLSWAFPEVYEEVLITFDLDVEEWRRLKSLLRVRTSTERGLRQKGDQ